MVKVTLTVEHDRLAEEVRELLKEYPKLEAIGLTALFAQFTGGLAAMIGTNQMAHADQMTMIVDNIKLGNRETMLNIVGMPVDGNS